MHCDLIQIKHLYYSQIGSRSSVYSPESRVRKTGSYIYEDFMPTDGTDVKVRKSTKIQKKNTEINDILFF